VTAPVRLAVLGDPLRYTRSPELHRAGAAAAGLSCESHALRTPLAELGATLARLEAEGYAGCNLTMPLKAAALACMAETTPRAARARSVNTVTFRARGSQARLGDSTDGAGFVALLEELRRDVAESRVVLLGAGGAARSLALALADAGSSERVLVSRREPAAGDESARVAAATWCAWGSDAAHAALARAHVVVNCTPLMRDELPVPRERIAPGALVVDLAYGPELTPWVVAARAQGYAACDGLGLLVHQARLSLSGWFGRDVPLAPLAAAVGWPR
jgi:shikimate dehydrogenase